MKLPWIVGVLITAGTLPGWGATISASADCSSGNLSVHDGGPGVLSASCSLNGSTANASVTISGSGVSVVASSFPFSSASSSASYQGLVFLTVSVPDPITVPHGFYEVLVNHVGSASSAQVDLLHSCSGGGGTNCLEFFLGRGSLTANLSASSPPSGSSAGFSIGRFWDANGNLLTNVQYTLVQTPEPGTSSLVLLAAIPALAILVLRRRHCHAPERIERRFTATTNYVEE